MYCLCWRRRVSGRIQNSFASTHKPERRQRRQDRQLNPDTFLEVLKEYEFDCRDIEWVPSACPRPTSTQLALHHNQERFSAVELISLLLCQDSQQDSGSWSGNCKAGRCSRHIWTGESGGVILIARAGCVWMLTAMRSNWEPADLDV